DGSTVDANVNGAFTVDSIVATSLPGFTAGTYVASTTYPDAPTQVDGQGKFNLVIDNTNKGSGTTPGFTTAASQIVVTLTGSWADASSVLIANDSGNIDAAHIFVCSGDATTCSVTSTALSTGFAGGTPIPIPPAIGLLVSGLAGLGFLGRRRRKTQA